MEKAAHTVYTSINIQSLNTKMHLVVLHIPLRLMECVVAPRRGIPVSIVYSFSVSKIIVRVCLSVSLTLIHQPFSNVRILLNLVHQLQYTHNSAHRPLISCEIIILLRRPLQNFAFLYSTFALAANSVQVLILPSLPEFVRQVLDSSPLSSTDSIDRYVETFQGVVI